MKNSNLTQVIWISCFTSRKLSIVMKYTFTVKEKSQILVIRCTSKKKKKMHGSRGNYLICILISKDKEVNRWNHSSRGFVLSLGKMILLEKKMSNSIRHRIVLSGKRHYLKRISLSFLIYKNNSIQAAPPIQAYPINLRKEYMEIHHH